METVTKVKERPVLFSTPMVKAILEGRKIVTRRVIRESFNGCLTNGGPHPCPNEPVVFYPGEEIYQFGEPIKVDYPEVRAIFHCSTLDSEAKCPYGKPGDILWVRETHYRYGHWRRNGVTKKGNPKWAFVPYDDEVRYFDNPPERFKISRDKREPHVPCWYKRLGRFMPKWACRMRLRITSIRVEPLHDITGEEARMEGVEWMKTGWKDYLKDGVWFDAKSSFQSLWWSINGEESWKANPWVWRVEFKKS